MGRFIFYLVSIVILITTVYLYLNFKQTNSKRNQRTVSYLNISPTELKNIINSKNEIFLLDVHTPEQEHLKETDMFIPFDKLQENFELLPKNKDTEIIVYCRGGTMSEIAAEELLDMGYTKIKNLEGGKNAWDLFIQK